MVEALMRELRVVYYRLKEMTSRTESWGTPPVSGSEDRDKVEWQQQMYETVNHWREREEMPNQLEGR